MLVEAKIAELLKILSPEECAFLHSYLKTFGVTNKPLLKFQAGQVIKASKSDKKVRAGKPYYVLLESIGRVYKKDGQFAHAVKDSVVKRALQLLTK